MSILWLCLEVTVQLFLSNRSIRNISGLVGCIKKLSALYEVQLIESYKIPQLHTHLTWPRNRIFAIRPPFLNSLDRTIINGIFHPMISWGLQQSLFNINFSFCIFMSKYQRKSCATLIVSRWLQDQSMFVDSDGLFLTAIFTH